MTLFLDIYECVYGVFCNDNENNAVIALQIIFAMHKSSSNRVILMPYVQPLLTKIAALYKQVPVTLSQILHTPVDRLSKHDTSLPEPALTAAAAATDAYSDVGGVTAAETADAHGTSATITNLANGVDNMDVVGDAEDQVGRSDTANSTSAPDLEALPPNTAATSTTSTAVAAAAATEVATAFETPSTLSTNFKILAELPLLINTILHIYTQLTSANIAGTYME